MTPIHFTADCQIQAAADKQPRVSILAYSGSIMRVPGFGAVVLDLAGMELATIPLLADHENKLGGIAGSGTPTVADGKLTVVGTLAPGTAAAEQILALHRSGVRLQASIGAEPSEQRFIDAGKSIVANGKSHTAPAGGFTFVTKSKLREVSFVAAGADSQTSVSIAASKRQKMSTPLDSFISTMLPGKTSADFDGDELARLHANMEGRGEPIAADFTATAGMICATADDDEMRLRKLERQLAMKERLEKLEASIPVAHTVTGSRRDGDAKVIEAALCLSAGVQNPESHFDERTLTAADRHFRGMGLQQVLLQAAVANGYQPMGSVGVNQSNLRQVLAYALPSIQASGFSTMSIPTILSNTSNRFLKEGWDSVDQTVLRIAFVRSARDFKQLTTVSLIGGFVFEKIASDGEIKHGSAGELSYTNKIDTYARMTAITRQDIVNDDLSALSAVPKKLGRGAMLKLNDIGWSMFLNNSDFFKSGNSNVSTGAGSVLGDAGLEAAEKVFLNQKDPDGHPLGVMPSILLVPPSLKARARKLLNSALLVGSTMADALQPSGNVWQGAYRLESSPYLEIATFPGFSAEAWYLLADPAQIAVLEIAALNGNVMPTIDTAEADFHQLGIQMRGYSDIGVSLQEFRGGVRGAGS